MGTNLIAVLIDGDNVSASHIPAIMEHARRLGEPLARCVVGDFSAGRLSKWLEIASDHSLEPIFQPSGGKGKNSADIALTIRAMDLLAEKRFDRFLIVSSDRDFAPLALRLRRSGVEVYGIGEEEKSGIVWRAACTEFFVLAGEEAPAKSVGIADAKPAAAKTPVAVAKSKFSERDVKQLRTIIEEMPPEHGGILLPLLDAKIRDRVPELAMRFCVKGKFLRNLLSVELVDEVGDGSNKRVRLKVSEHPGQVPSRPTSPPPSPSAARPPA